MTGRRRTRPLGRRLQPAAVAALALVIALTGAGTAPAQRAGDAAWARWGGGAALRESDLGAGTWVAVVWASWAPRCRDLDRRVAELRRVVGAQARIVAVNYEEAPEAAADFLRQKDLGVPAFFDPEGSFARRYRVSTLPAMVVLRDGEVVFRGKLPDDLAGAMPGILAGAGG